MLLKTYCSKIKYMTIIHFDKMCPILALPTSSISTLPLILSDLMYFFKLAESLYYS